MSKPIKLIEVRCRGCNGRWGSWYPMGISRLRGYNPENCETFQYRIVQYVPVKK